jgi:hypothetical protein
MIKSFAGKGSMNTKGKDGMNTLRTGASVWVKLWVADVNGGILVGKDNGNRTGIGKKGVIAVEIIPFRSKPPNASIAKSTPARLIPPESKLPRYTHHAMDTLLRTTGDPRGAIVIPTVRPIAVVVMENVVSTVAEMLKAPPTPLATILTINRRFVPSTPPTTDLTEAPVINGIPETGKEATPNQRNGCPATNPVGERPNAALTTGLAIQPKMSLLDKIIAAISPVGRKLERLTEAGIPPELQVWYSTWMARIPILKEVDVTPDIGGGGGDGGDINTTTPSAMMWVVTAEIISVFIEPTICDFICW